MYLPRGVYFTKEFQPHTEGKKDVKQDFMKKKQIKSRKMDWQGECGRGPCWKVIIWN